MTIQKRLLIYLFPILLLGLGFWNLKVKNQTSFIQNERVVQEFKANLQIKDGKTNPTFDISQFIGRRVLEATQNVTNGNVKVDGTDERATVTGIGGQNADSKKHEQWVFYINGIETKEKVNVYKIQNNDYITWKLEVKTN